MVRLVVLSALIPILISGCALNQPIKPTSDADWLMLRTYPGGPSCKRCNSTTLIIHHDGKVIAEQGYWLFGGRIWQGNRRKATIDELMTVQLLRQLEDIRPKGTIDLSKIEACAQYMAETYPPRGDDAEYRTDHPGIMLRWRDKDGDDTLDADFGCLGAETVAFKDGINSALRKTGIAWLELPE